MFFSFTILSLALYALAAPIQLRQNCAEISVFFARGTTELGTLGTVVGPRFKSTLQRELPGRAVDFVGIEYPANFAGFFAGGDAEGAATMANSVTAQATACPNTKIFISGYSQGAQVAHLAAGQLSADVQKRVNGAVVFGDPLNGTAFSGSIPSKTFCASGDNICEGGFQVRFAHFSYGANAGEAAKFVASLL